jgi:hypothetical protein
LPVRIKQCSGPCGQSYPITHFWSDAGAPDGHMSRCPTCEKAARQARREARANGELEGQPDRNGRVVAFSEEERKRRSELAKRLHEEGRFGGAVIGRAGGQAAKRHLITDAVLEYFRQPDKQQLVVKAVESNLKGKNKLARLSAVRELRQMEEQQTERQRADRGGAVNPDVLPDDELQVFVMQGLEAMIARGEIPVDVVIDGEAHEVE